MKKTSSNANMKEPLDILQNVKRVEVSPFLFTRIQQRIAHKQAEPQTTSPLLWLGFASLLLVLMLDIWVIGENRQQKSESSLAQMAFLPHNNLYDE